MDRPIPSDFADALDDPRANRWHALGTALLAGFFVLAAVGMIVPAVPMLLAGRTHDASAQDAIPAWLLGLTGGLAVLCAVAGGLALARAGRIDDAAAAPMQRAVAADLWITYRLRVSPRQIPTEPGQKALVIADADGITVPVAVVFPDAHSPIELTRTSVSA